MKAPPIATKDPFCGMTVDEATAIHADRYGTTFYFCSDTCRKKFISASAGPHPGGKPKSYRG